MYLIIQADKVSIIFMILADYKKRHFNASDCSTRQHGHLLASSAEGIIFWGQIRMQKGER